jgi:hypothetical protein
LNSLSSGWNLRLKDPGLLLPQIAASVVIQLGFLVLAPKADHLKALDARYAQFAARLATLAEAFQADRRRHATGRLARCSARSGPGRMYDSFKLVCDDELAEPALLLRQQQLSRLLQPILEAARDHAEDTG